mgnify:CR=1 FL=1
MPGRCPVEENVVKQFFLAPRNDEQETEINFDLTRMKKAVSGGSVRPPAGLTREERRKWIQQNAGKCNA